MEHNAEITPTANTTMNASDTATLHNATTAIVLGTVLHVRKIPSIRKGELLGTCSRDDVVEVVLDKSDDEWSYIRGKAEGYVLNEYLEFSQTDPVSMKRQHH